MRRCVRLLGSDLTDAMKEGSANTTAGGARQRFRSALVVVELALAVVLLIGAGLMLRTLWALQRIDLGFNPSGVLTMRISLPEAGYRQPEQVVDFYSRLLDRRAASPGRCRSRRRPVAAARIDHRRFRSEDRRLRATARHQCERGLANRQRRLSRRDRRAAGSRTRHRGSDTTDGQLVALINEEMARRYWAGRDPIGGRLSIGMDPKRPWLTVVGIVKDVRHNGVTGVVKEKFYVPHTQWHKSIGNPIRAMTLVVRATGHAGSARALGARRHPPARSRIFRSPTCGR